MPFDRMNFLRQVTKLQKVGCNFNVRKLSAYTDVSKNMVTIEWDSEQHDSFPSCWLRDNCQCPKCFHSGADGRLINLHQTDPNIQPKDVNIHNKQLFIQWQDEHESCFQFDWLQKRSFKSENTWKKLQNETGGNERRVTLWDSSMKIPTFEFEGIMNSDHNLCEWLEVLNSYGLSIIKNMPSYTFQALMDRIGPIRETHYGKVFQVFAKVDPSNVAYTSSRLALHCDLPFYQYIPGCQFLHCVKQSGMIGGENEFVDTFKVAEAIRQEHPEAFKCLSEIKVNFKDIGHEEGREFHKKMARKIIQLDNEGNIRGVFYNDQVRDSMLSVPLEQVQPLYAGLKLFLDLCYDQKFMHVHKLKPGECVAFDNTRVLHGRKGYSYKDKSSGERFLQGAYIDWDEIWSRINVLKHKSDSSVNGNID